MKKVTIVIEQDEDGYVAYCLDYGVVSQGDTHEEALSNIKEAVEGFLEVASPAEIQDRLAQKDIRQLDVEYA